MPLTSGWQSACVQFVTTAQPDSDRETRVATASKPVSVGKRVSEWFWRGELAKKRRALPKLGVRAQALARRAQGSADLAQNGPDVARSAALSRSALTPGEPSEALAAANTCELYRQSVYWALCALAANSNESAGSSYEQATWETLDEPLLLSAVDKHRVLPVRSSLRDGSFVYFAELSRAEQLALSSELRKLSEVLLAKVNERSVGLREISSQRRRRVSLAFLLAVAVAGTAVWEHETRDARRDLAEGSPWRASSTIGGGCISPEQTCPESPGFFFHTQEEKEPTVSFDLGVVKSISRVRVDNRKDCCTERAFPLVVEVSEDQGHWQAVARQDAVFTSWRATFTPVKARWLRLRVEKTTFLHLARVRILR